MARTAQTARREDDPILHSTEAVDHRGERIIRVRLSKPHEVIPLDFKKDPVFAFQIYSTIPLNLDDEETMAQHLEIPTWHPRDKRNNLIAFLANLIESEAQRPSPLFEIYTRKDDVFACVEHQRREIAHRKAAKDDSSTLLIPRVVLNPHDSRRMGFIFVITSESFRTGPRFPELGFDPNGPLYVHFDRAFPSATSLDRMQRLQDDPEVAKGLGIEVDEIDVFPEKMDVQVVRVQKTVVKRSHLAAMYRQSYMPNDTLGGCDFALDLDEGLPDDDADAEVTIENLPPLINSLELDGLESVETDSMSVTISRAAEDKEVDIRYLIYVPFLHQEGQESTLQEVAHAFTSNMTSRFADPYTSFSFEFHQPSSPSLSNILESARSILSERPVDFIGTRIDTSKIPLFSSNGNAPSTEESWQRLHPIQRSDSLAFNLPSNSAWHPYRTFVVILDRLDFASVPGGMRFLLADGGKIKTRPEEAKRPLSFQGEAQDFVEMQVWRSAGIEEVAKRLQMRELAPHEKVTDT